MSSQPILHFMTSEELERESKRDKGRGTNLLIGFLLVGLVVLALYVALHVLYPAGPLSPATSALGIVRQAGLVLAAETGETMSDSNRKTLEGFTGELRVLQPRLAASEEVSATVEAIAGELAQQARKGELTSLFERLGNEIQLSRTQFLWTGSSDRYLEMVFWAMFGTIVFLMSEIKKYYPAKYDPDAIYENRRSFRAHTPWYVVNLFRGPAIALAILFALSGISVDIVGITLDVKQAPIEALIFLAFVLGFYSRVAEKWLDTIVIRFLPDAANRAGLVTLSINPDKVTLLPNHEETFTLQPQRTVEWFLMGPGKLADGKYTAPQEIWVEGQATVLAVATDDHAITGRAKITLVPPDKDKGVGGDSAATEAEANKTPPEKTATGGGAAPAATENVKGNNGKEAGTTPAGENGSKNLNSEGEPVRTIGSPDRERGNGINDLEPE